VVVLVVIGAFVWTLILASFCDVATNGNAALIRFRHQLDGLNMLIAMHGLPRELAHKARTYMHKQKGVLLREDTKQVLPLLSPALQIEIVLHVHRHWLEAVWFIRDLDAPIKVRLAMAMQPKVLAPKELAPNRQLYVINRGLIMFGSRILSHGMTWGDDVILTNRKWFLPFFARAMAYSDVAYVTRAALYELAAPYPETVRKMRRATLVLALRRALVVKLREHQYRDAHSTSFIKRNPQSNALGTSAGEQTGQYGSFLKRFDMTSTDVVEEEEPQNLALSCSLQASAETLSSQHAALEALGVAALDSCHLRPLLAAAAQQGMPGGNEHAQWPQLVAAAQHPQGMVGGDDERAANEQTGILRELRDSMRALTEAVEAMHQDLKRSEHGSSQVKRVGPLVPLEVVME